MQIGHGVTIGRNVLLAAQVGIAGSTDVHDDVVFGGQVGVGGHLTIGRGAVAVGQSGVTNSLEPRAMVAGYPAIDSRDWRKASVLFKRLPELKRRIEALETRIARVLSSSAESKPERSSRVTWSVRTAPARLGGADGRAVRQLRRRADLRRRRAGAGTSRAAAAHGVPPVRRASVRTRT